LEPFSHGTRSAGTRLATPIGDRYARRMLVVRGLAKSFAGPRPRSVFAGVDLDLAPGEYVAVMGESGRGKATVLNLIAALARLDSRSMALEGVSLSSLDDVALTLLRRERFGFVFQAFHVLPYLTVAQNVALPLSLLGVDGLEAGRRASVILAKVGLEARDAS